MKKQGRLLQLDDGRMGIAFHKEQIIPGKFIIKVIDDDFNPVISEKTGKQVTVFKLPSECELIGFID